MELENIVQLFPNYQNKIKNYYTDISGINSFLKDKKIVIPEENINTFWNHVIMLLERIQNKELINLEEEVPKKEIDENSLNLANELLEPLFLKYQVTEKNSENILLALYFSLFEIKGGN